MPRSENYSTDSVQSFKSNFREHLTPIEESGRISLRPDWLPSDAVKSCHIQSGRSRFMHRATIDRDRFGVQTEGGL